MEVHAHSHTARKKWTHYLWEFLMLFLAVFCGFLAENIREHSIEKKRLRVYMMTLVNDLKTDTTFINGVVDGNKIIQKKFDTLVLLLDHIDPANKAQLDSAYTIFYTWGYSPSIVTFSDRTITQLKSSGLMRLVEDMNLSDRMLFYYMAVDVCNKQADTYMEDQNDLIRLSYKFFDKLYQRKGHEGFTLAKKLILDNPAALREFINRADDLKEVMDSYNQLIAQAKTFAIALLEKIKEEYKIKE